MLGQNIFLLDYLFVKFVLVYYKSKELENNLLVLYVVYYKLMILILDIFLLFVNKELLVFIFPFVITTLEFHQVVNEYLGFEEKVNWLLCFFYIIENCDRELLHDWWDRSSPTKHLKLFFNDGDGYTSL